MSGHFFELPPFPLFCADVLALDMDTRTAHVAIAKALDGLPLDAVELALFAEYTGRETPDPAGYPYALILVGRQGGKSEQAAARLVYEAVAASLAGDRGVACVGVSQGHREARNTLFSYVSRFLEAPLLADLVISQTADTIILEGDVMVMVSPCRHESLRGLRCRCVVLDEVCHFRSSEARPLDREVWRAALATTLTTAGKVVALSSPYGASGLAYTLHKQYYGGDNDVLIWQSPSYVLHPGLSEAALQRIRDVDPEGAEAEIEGRFLANVAALLDDDVLEAAVDDGVTVREPVKGVHYVGFVDVATGTKAGNDRWAVAIAHQEAGVAVLDAVLAIAPPFSPSTAAKQTARLCSAYSLTTIVGDRFAQGFTGEGFAKVGLEWEPASVTKSDIYLQFAAALQSGTVRLLDLPEVLREARTLERRRGPTKDRVDHVRGARDDAVNVAAGALMLAAREPASTRLTWGTPGWRVRPGYISTGATRRIQPSRHNPRVAQDLTDYMESTRERHEQLQERVRRDMRRAFERRFRHR